MGFSRSWPPRSCTLVCVAGEPDRSVVPALVARYRSAAVSHGQATLSGDYKKANATYRVLDRAYSRLGTLGDDGQRALIQLLSDPDPSVRKWAARYLLFLEPHAAEKALMEVAELPGIIGFGAGITLREWRAGRLKPA
jgi:HEAT repeat protein